MDYDVCIIGAGWAGFNAAISAVKLGKKACIVEENEIGGTCLNRGCIPTKAFVYNSKKGLPLLEIQRKKTEVVERLKSGMNSLIKSNKIDYFQGKAKIESSTTVSVGTDKKISAKFILIATGTVPRDLPQLKFDHNRIISSDDVLVLIDLPKKILIVGAGAIGCEFACIFKKLGSEVTILEICPQILPGFDTQVAKKLQQSFQKAGITVLLGKGCETLNLEDYDKVLVAVGRKCVTDGSWTEAVGIKIEKGSICVDRELRTNVQSIFAAGDCIGGYMLAHVASYEGELAINNMFSTPSKRDYSVIPGSVFTTPELSSVGISEEEAKKFGASYEAKTVHFLSVGMAHILEDTQGFAKVIVENNTGRILGASIIGLQASELVNAFSILMKNNITIQQARKTIFAHPSISEIIAELARAF